MKGSSLHKNNHSWEIFQEVEQRLKKEKILTRQIQGNEQQSKPLEEFRPLTLTAGKRLLLNQTRKLRSEVELCFEFFFFFFKKCALFCIISFISILQD